MYIYICIFIYLYTYIYTHTHIHTSTHLLQLRERNKHIEFSQDLQNHFFADKARVIRIALQQKCLQIEAPNSTAQLLFHHLLNICDAQLANGRQFPLRRCV